MEQVDLVKPNLRNKKHDQMDYKEESENSSFMEGNLGKLTILL